MRESGKQDSIFDSWKDEAGAAAAFHLPLGGAAGLAGGGEKQGEEGEEEAEDGDQDEGNVCRTRRIVEIDGQVVRVDACHA